MLKPRKKQKFTSESELAESVVVWLKAEGWEVYKEVKPLKFNETADIIATRDGMLWVIECKLIYGSKVLEQAFNWSKYADFVSIAVPRTYNKNIVLDFFLREKGIGRFWIAPSSSPLTKFGYVHLDISPKMNLNANKQPLVSSLREEQKSSIAGSLSGGSVTPYKLTIDQIRAYLQANGATPLPKIVDSIKHHYKTRESALGTLAKRLLDLETDFETVLVQDKKCFQLKVTQKP